MSAPLWLPDVIRKPIPAGDNDPPIIPVGDIFHVAVSKADSLHSLFGNDGGIESTGYIRRDGTLEQYRPLDVECDAQFDGNSWIGPDGRRYGFNSWETQGMGEGEWTPEQLATIKRIISFKHQHYGHPLRLAPAWNEPGFGYHCLFVQWNKTNHSCPGPDRVRQFNEIIVPWMTQGARLSEEDPMPTPADVWNHQVPIYDGKKGQTKHAHVVLSQAHNRAGDARTAARACLDGLQDLAKLVGDSKLTDAEKAHLADQVASETAAAVEAIDAAAVAEQLEITPKK